MSSKLFRFVMVFIVIMVIATSLYKSLLGSNSEPWERVAFDNVKAAMQEGVMQIHWQWQYEGRPESIQYQSSELKRVDINVQGWPDLAASRQACHDFLDLFAGKAMVEVSGLELDVNAVQQLGIAVELVNKQDTKDLGNYVDICRYSRLGQEFEYYLGTGNLF